MKKNVNAISVAAGTVVCFAVVLLLNRVGPLADDGSFGSSVLKSAFVALVFAVIMTLSVRRSDRPKAPVALDADTSARVDALLAEGKDVAAIKAVRDATGAGLAEAKATVDARR